MRFVREVLSSRAPLRAAVLAVGCRSGHLDLCDRSGRSPRTVAAERADRQRARQQAAAAVSGILVQLAGRPLIAALGHGRSGGLDRAVG